MAPRPCGRPWCHATCRFDPALPRGFCKRRLREVRARRRLEVDIHHVLPREYSAHPVVRAYGYDVERGYNLVFLPTRPYDGTRRVHMGGHHKYNAMVGEKLDVCTSRASFLLLLCLLHAGSRGRVTVPWR